jgi:hypothetical protein
LGKRAVMPIKVGTLAEADALGIARETLVISSMPLNGHCSMSPMADRTEILIAGGGGPSIGEASNDAQRRLCRVGRTAPKDRSCQARITAA